MLTKDRQHVAECTGVTDVQTAGIISSRYTPQETTLQPSTLRPPATRKKLARVYPGKAASFRHADKIYRNRSRCRARMIGMRGSQYGAAAQEIAMQRGPALLQKSVARAIHQYLQ